VLGRDRQANGHALLDDRLAGLMKFLARVAVALVLLSACAPSAPPPATAPAKADASHPQLAEVVANAKLEGKVSISGPTAEVWRKSLSAFHDDYPEIQVEYTGGDSRDFWPKLAQERNGNQYLWDVRIGGPDPQVFDARDSGVLDPIRPLLFLPEVVDESKWVGGWDGFYADVGKQYLPGFLASVSKTAYLNARLVSPQDVKSEQDLLDPRWKGKIVIQDPRGGAGLAFLTTFLEVDGEAFVRALLSQDVVVSGDNRQIAEWLVRGRYPIAVGVRSYDLLPFFQQGLGQDVKPVEGMRAQALSIGSGGIQLMNRAPHPSSAKLFVNWVLTQRIQQRITQAVQDNSRRLDVPPGDPERVPDPNQMGAYVANQTEELLPTRRKAQQIAGELLNR
jgi:ABC-type Fe3+ transport system substrate-binding protein